VPASREAGRIAVGLPTFEVELFDTQARGPRLRDCNFPGDKPVLAQEQSGALLFNVLEERWATVSANKRCAPEF
jgi:hypothetical protein